MVIKKCNDIKGDAAFSNVSGFYNFKFDETTFKLLKDFSSNEIEPLVKPFASQWEFLESFKVHWNKPSAV